MSLERRTPLRRGKPLARGRANLARGAPLRRGGQLNPMSRKRLAVLPEREKIRRQVFDRDGRCLLRGIDSAGLCMGRRTPHHVLKAGSGGAYDAQNLVQLCAHHNDWIETADGQPLAFAYGLWCRRGDTLEECWARMRAAGLVTYDWTGAPA